MTTHRESVSITAVIDALSHTNITTKKSALETLKTALDTEQALVDDELANLHAHREKVTGMITNLTNTQDGEEYTVLDAQGVFSAAEKTQILADVLALQSEHPSNPITVYENLSNNDDLPILASDKIVLVKHDQVTGLVCTLPSDASNGQIIVIKNYMIGDGSGGGNYIITVRPAQSQTPSHQIDYKYDSLELKCSTVAGGVGSLMSDENEAARLLWYDLDKTWISLQDAY